MGCLKRMQMVPPCWPRHADRLRASCPVAPGPGLPGSGCIPPATEPRGRAGATGGRYRCNLPGECPQQSIPRSLSGFTTRPNMPNFRASAALV